MGVLSEDLKNCIRAFIPNRRANAVLGSLNIIAAELDR